VDRKSLVGFHRAKLVDRITDDIQNPSECPGSDRDSDRQSGINSCHPPDKTVSCLHGNSPDLAIAEVQSYLKRDVKIKGAFSGIAFLLNLQGVKDFRHLFFKLNVHNRTDNLRDLSYIAHWLTPEYIFIFSFSFLSFKGLDTADDVHKFLGDCSLPCLVVLERQA
jgi:hypothetical protein